MCSLNFLPDWTHVWTAEEAEEQLSGFKFSGPGWYLTKSDSILVLPMRGGPGAELSVNNTWRQLRPKGERFTFMVYNGYNPCAAFNAVANAPVRLDQFDYSEAQR